MAIYKYLQLSTPNLAEQSNSKEALLWDIAGRLQGMEVESVIDGTLVPPSEGGPFAANHYGIKIKAGSFIHQGIVVQETTPKTLDITKPTSGFSFPLNQAVFLVAQANGANNAANPIYSLITEFDFNNRSNSKNYAAIIAIYRTKIDLPERDIDVLFDASTSTWTTQAGGSTNHISIVNGLTPAAPVSSLQGAATQVETLNLANLPSSNINTVNKLLLGISTVADSAGATVSSDGQITFTVGAALITERVSIFINTVEVSVLITPAFANTTLTALLAAILADPYASTIIASGVVGGGAATATLTLTSIPKGNAGNYDLRFTTDSVAVGTSVAVVSQPTNGVQGFFTLDFPEIQGGTTTVIPVTVYPPVKTVGLAPSLTDFETITIQIPLGGMTLATFNQLKARLTRDIIVTNLFVNRVTMTVTFSELNNGIDPNPPFDLTHWFTGSSVAVGGASGGLAAHRTLIPIDHPDRSIITRKLAFGCVDKDIIDIRVIGAGYTYHVHTVADLTTPSLLGTNSYTIKDLSDIAKRLIGNVEGVSGVATLFGKDHNFAITAGVPSGDGHHRTAKYADIVAGITSQGMRVGPPAAPGDSGLDRTGDVTKSQFFLDNGAGNSITAPSIARTTVLIGGTPVETLTIGSKSIADDSVGSLAANRDVALQISMEGNAGVATKKRFFSLAKNETGLKDMYGVKSIDGGDAIGSISSKTSLFSGDLSFMQTSGTCASRLTAATGRIFSGLDAETTSTSFDTAGTSYNPPLSGAVLYNERRALERQWDSALTAPGGNVINSIGSFPLPVSGEGNTVWVYLPFVKANSFDKVVVRASMAGVVQASISGQTNIDVVTSMSAAPATDFAEHSPAPTLSGATFPAGTFTPPFFASPAGVVRRFPWVLTPTGYPKLAGLGIHDSVYYNPGTFPNYNPKGFFGGALFSNRVGNTNQPAAGSILNSRPLPYYDRRTQAGADSGIVIDVAKIRNNVAFNHLVAPTYTVNVWAWNAHHEIEIPIKGATISTRAPDGIAVNIGRWDWGIMGKSITSGVNILDLYAKFYFSTVHLEIDGVSDGVYTPILTSLV